MDPLQIAHQAIADIAARFPTLRMVENPEDPVELSITLPIQPGLKQKVWLCLQNIDELHFSVGNFWLEWFPCTNPDRVREYVEAVCGYLSGEYRVLEHYRGKRCVKAELQAPAAADWKTIGTWSRLSLPIPWEKSFNEVRNA
jgi:hypothetical protein